MLKKGSSLICTIILLLTITGCSGNTNKANLEPEAFKNAVTMVQYMYDEENVSNEEVREAKKWARDKGESGDFASDEEELLFSQLDLISHKRRLSAIKGATSYISGEAIDNTEHEEIEEIFKEIEEVFGINYKG